MAEEKLVDIKAADEKHGRARWYVVTTKSGEENRIKENIEARITSMGMEKYIFQVFVANVEVDVMRKGEPTGKTRIKNKYPRFIFVEMKMGDDSWYIVRNTPGVTGIVGSSGKGTKPVPVPQKEMDDILKACGHFEGGISNKFDSSSIGKNVKIVKGTYIGMTGTIVEVDKETNTVCVAMSMLGTTSDGLFPFEEVDLIK